MGWNVISTNKEAFGVFFVFAHQHSSASESHHAQPAFEHEALKVGGGHLQLEGFGAVGSVGFLSFSVRIVHALHVFSQLIFPLSTKKEKKGLDYTRRTPNAG